MKVSLALTLVEKDFPTETAAEGQIRFSLINSDGTVVQTFDATPDTLAVDFTGVTPGVYTGTSVLMSADATTTIGDTATTEPIVVGDVVPPAPAPTTRTIKVPATLTATVSAE